MTPEELLKPRVLVATDWPGRRDFEVGQIILLDKIFGDGSPMWEITDCQGTRRYIKKFFEMFPLQFKFLEWWEERDEIDYPEYVKTAVWGELVIGKVSRITPNGVIISGFKTKEGADGCYQTFNYIIPATESEYNEYINQNKK